MNAAGGAIPKHQGTYNGGVCSQAQTGPGSRHLIGEYAPGSDIACKVNQGKSVISDLIRLQSCMHDEGQSMAV